MQSRLGRPAAGARQAGICSRWGRGGRVCALLLSLMASACANIGQIGNMTEGRRVAVAFESVDGPPMTVVHKFIGTLKEEAGARQLAVVTPGEANYRLRGYLAAHAEAGGTAITWAWDVYDANQRRAFRLGGVERADGGARNRWVAADDQVLRKIARTGIEQFAVFASSRPSQAPALVSAPTPPERNRSTFAWLDDWAPEASGIFRIFRREEPRTEAATETALSLPQSDAIPLPRGRPAPSDTSPESALAFAAPDH